MPDTDSPGKPTRLRFIDGAADLWRSPGPKAETPATAVALAPLHEEGGHNSASPNLLARPRRRGICGSLRRLVGSPIRCRPHRVPARQSPPTVSSSFWPGRSAPITPALGTRDHAGLLVAGQFCRRSRNLRRQPHMWSGQAIRPTQVLHVRGRRTAPPDGTSAAPRRGAGGSFGHKGKCYSALIHMLGTRSAAERLAQLLLLIANLRRSPAPEAGIAIGRG